MKKFLCVFVILCVVPVVWPAKHTPQWKKQACALPVQNEHSHYICDEKGEPKCLPGWQGDLCDVPSCKRGCDPIQGYCKRPGECRCKLGFYGEKCNKCIPLPGCQHGYCNVSFECICKDGWDGLFCSEPICRSDCHATRGYCDSPGECRCRLGWAGPTCRSCQTLPGCQHGYCDKPLECKCNPGYTGLLCQTPICAPDCHNDHGFCRRPGDCRCKVGWTSRTCSECHPYPGCVHGTCNKPWECNCEPGWGGMLCDEELNYCDKNKDTCKNGGKCQSLESGDGSYRCQCPPGVGGKNCEDVPTNSTYLEGLDATSQNPDKVNVTTVSSVENSSAETGDGSDRPLVQNPPGVGGKNCEDLPTNCTCLKGLNAESPEKVNATTVSSVDNTSVKTEPKNNEDTCKNRDKCQSLESDEGSNQCQCPPRVLKSCEELTTNSVYIKVLNAISQNLDKDNATTVSSVENSETHRNETK